MSVSPWVNAHTQGWPVFLAVAVGFAAATAVAYARGRLERIPWIFLVAWLGGVAGLYVMLHLGRLRTATPRLWVGELVVITLAVLVPLVILLVVLAVWRRAVRGRWTLGAVVAGMAGTLAMTLSPAVSMGTWRLLRDWIMAGHP